jgi:hypothetical protein
MSRWDPEPTPFQRWIVRHLTKIRVGAVLWMVLGICAAVYVLMTDGLGMAVVVPICAIVQSIGNLLTSRDISRFVEKYDSARYQGPSSG